MDSLYFWGLLCKELMEVSVTRKGVGIRCFRVGFYTRGYRRCRSWGTLSKSIKITQVTPIISKKQKTSKRTNPIYTHHTTPLKQTLDQGLVFHAHFLKNPLNPLLSQTPSQPKLNITNSQEVPVLYDVAVLQRGPGFIRGSDFTRGSLF